MRDVIDRGTGASIRSRFGIRGDVAGKTGTTQDNADGWFILMHPELVAGAWVGFNDSRVTLRSDYWGQGAHSALPIVGDFYQRSLRSRIIDGRARFTEQEESGAFSALVTHVRGWFTRLFGGTPAPEAPAARPAPRRPALPSPEADVAPQPPAPMANAPDASDASGMALDRGEVLIATPEPRRLRFQLRRHRRTQRPPRHRRARPLAEPALIRTATGVPTTSDTPG